MEVGRGEPAGMIVAVDGRYTRRRDDLDVGRRRTWTRGRAGINLGQRELSGDFHHPRYLEEDRDVGGVTAGVALALLDFLDGSVAEDRLEAPAEQTAAFGVGGEDVRALDMHRRTDLLAWVGLEFRHGVVVVLSCFCFFSQFCDERVVRSW